MLWVLTVFVFLSNGHSYNFEIGRYEGEQDCRAEAQRNNTAIVESHDDTSIKVDCVPTDENV